MFTFSRHPYLKLVVYVYVTLYLIIPLIIRKSLHDLMRNISHSLFFFFFLTMSHTKCLQYITKIK